MFTGDLYSMYVVLKGIWSLPYIRVYMIYVIPFGEQQPWMSEVPKLQRFNKKNGYPEMINFFLYCIINMNFSGSPKGTPHDWCRRIMEKKLFCNENQWNWVVFLKKLMDIFTWDLYSMYVVLQGIRYLSCIRVYIIYVIPFGEQQPWMSEVPKLERFNKKTGPPK